MARRSQKSEIISFKADEELIQALDGVPNRSEFIRSAVLSALDNVCPLCSGSGILTAHQKRHWERFASDHHLEKCSTCEEMHLVCEREND